MKSYLPLLISVGLVACSHSVQVAPVTSVAASIEVDRNPGTLSDNQDRLEVGDAGSACPDDMVEISGDYCADLQIKCNYNVDADGKATKTPGDMLYSCGEYEATCPGDKMLHKHFCIDRYEWPNKPGVKPQDWMTWFDAKKAVESVGKRLCTAKEWTMAAEGPHYHPLPYGDGYHRDHSCNIDHRYSDVTSTPEFQALGLKGIDVFQSRRPDDKMSEALRLFLVPSGSMENCTSDYGVHDMAGNIDEWVLNEGGISVCPSPSGRCGGWMSGLKGGHVWHVRQNAFSMTDGHGPTFGWYETGTRACKDVAP